MPIRKDLTVPTVSSEAYPPQDQTSADIPEAIPANAAELCRKVQDEANPAIQEACFIEVLKIGGSEVVDGLLPLLRSEDAFLRNKVIETLREMPDDVAPKMSALLADADSDVRIFAINVLEALRHADVEAWLIDVGYNDTHPNVVGAALDLLAEVGSDDCVDALHEVGRRFPDLPYLGFAARVALKRIEASHDV